MREEGAGLQKGWLLAGALLWTGLVGLAWLSLPQGISLSPEGLNGFFLELGFRKAALLYFCLYALTIRPFIPVPAKFYTLTGGLIFGPLWGTLLTLAAASINASITYAIGRRLGANRTTGKTGLWLEKARRRLQGKGGRGVLLLRLVPTGIPFDVTSYGSGALRIPFRRYILATLFGMIPATIVNTFLGHSLSYGRWGFAGVGAGAIFALALWSSRPEFRQAFLRQLQPIRAWRPALRD
ncbi:MAG: TVP38/TMEM64 family protein [Acidobacteriota bacterium]